jgi:putative flippase GtrA
MSLLTKFIEQPVVRFALVGILNTASGYMLYLLFIGVMAYPIAYTISYVIGIIIAYVLNSVFVFKKPFKLSSAIQFPLVYVVQYAIGTLTLAILVENLRLDERLAPPVVIIVTFPVTYLMSRWIIVRK